LQDDRGKGLHLVAPLATADAERPTWNDAKAFARGVSVHLAGLVPDRFILNMSKALREKKIYLDYLRNGRAAMAVAPLSPRARPGAPVSMPLSWDQVGAHLDPSRYTVRTVPELLATTSAWAAYDASAGSLAAAMSALER
jgi:bifunctional non-homologous end joining protein LigD